jgi:hypothetical protein
MSIKIRLFGLRILVGCYRVTGGPFITVGDYSLSLRGITNLAELERELGFRD